MQYHIIFILCSILALSGCSAFSPSIPDQLNSLNEDYEISPEQARKQLLILKNEHKTDARPWINSGNWSLKEHEIERAKIAFRQALRLDAKNVDALIGLGICADQEKQHESAQDFYRQGLGISPNNVKLINNSAFSYILSKQPLIAITLLEPLIHTPSKDKSISHSIHIASTATENAEQNKVLSNLALAYLLNGDFDKAFAIDKRLAGEARAEHNRVAAQLLSPAKFLPSNEPKP